MDVLASEGWWEACDPPSRCNRSLWWLETRMKDPMRTPWECTASVCVCSGSALLADLGGKQIHGKWFSVMSYPRFFSCAFCTMSSFIGVALLRCCAVAFHFWLSGKKGIWSIKKIECWCDDDNALTEARCKWFGHTIDFSPLPAPPPSSVAAFLPTQNGSTFRYQMT